MAARLFSTLFILYLASISFANNQKNAPSSFVVYYQPLVEIDHSLSIRYVHETRTLLSKAKEIEFEKVLMNDAEKGRCSKSGKVCEEILFRTNACVPRGKKASRFCAQKSSKVEKDFFKDPLFNRISWNRFALKVNSLCNKKPNFESCQKLARLYRPIQEAHNLLLRKQIDKKAQEIEKGR